MRKTLISALTVALFGLSAQAQAVLAPNAVASIDWSTFSAQVFDLTPLDNIAAGLTWTYQDTSVTVTNSQNTSSVNDWTTSLSLSSSHEDASADASFLVASLFAIPNPPGGFGFASAGRYGDFSLTPGTLVLFTVHVDLEATGNENNQAYANMNVWGPDALNTGGNQSANSSLSAGAWSPANQVSGTLSTSFVNLSNANMTGGINVFGEVQGYTAPIPEPETYALLLAGLGLVGWMARRRQA
jgi:hypothetical protein